MDARKIKTYSKKQPVVAYKTTSALVPSYPDPRMNVRESRLNDKTLVFETFDDTFERLLGKAPLQSPKNFQNNSDVNFNRNFSELFKKPLSEELGTGMGGKKRKGKQDNQENLINKDLGMPKPKKRQKNLVKDKIKKPRHKTKVKKKVILKGIEDLQVKECTVNLSKCSTSFNLCNSNENNGKQNSSNVLGDFNKSKELIAFPQHLRSIDNLTSSTPRDHKPRMVVNVQNISPIKLDKDNRNGLKKRVTILLPDEQTDQLNKSNVLKELSLNNLENVSFDETIKSVYPRKSILKVTNIQRNSSENNPEKMSTEQNKIAEEIRDTDKNNCSITELLDSKNLHNSIDNRKSHESLNLSGQFSTAQQNTNKQSLDITPITNKKNSESVNFTDSPLLFDDSEDMNKISNKLHLEVIKMINSPIEIKNSSVLQKLDLDRVNTKRRIGNTIINESSFIPDDWTNDYNSTYEYGSHKEDSHNLNNSTSKSNKSSKEREMESKSCEDLLDNQNISQTEINDQTLTNETVQDFEEVAKTGETIKDFQEINKTDKTSNDFEKVNELGVFHETMSNKRNIRSGKDKSTKRKYDQTEEFHEIFNGKEPIIYINKIDETDEILLKKRRVSRRTAVKDIIENTVSEKITRRLSNKEKNKISDVVINNFNADDKIDINKTNRYLTVKVTKLENQNFKDISPVLPSRIFEELKKKLQKARVQTRKKEEQIEENQTKILNNSILENLQDQEKEKNVMVVNEINDSADNKDIDNSNDNTQDLNNLFSRLKDSATITMRRKTVKKRDRPLAAITEDQVDESLSNVNNKETEEQAIEKINLEMHNINSNKNLNEKSLAEENEINKSIHDCQSQPIFLKPGKSWARSLSIINHFHDLKKSQNLEKLAIGRGKNWRYSVQSVLNMQPEGTLHNISSNDEEGDFLSSSLSKRVSVRRETNPFSVVATSPSRISRFSMRIIPDGKRSTLTDDFVNSQRSSTTSNRTRKTSSSRKTSLKIRRDTLIETEEDLIKSAKDIVLKRCKQTSYLPFDACFPDSYTDKCSKIGEGVYGEVFLHQDEGKKSVLKIIPIEGNELVNCEPQKKFHEILSEIIIAEELHKLRFGDECNTSGFVGVNRIMCVIGKYPKNLIDLWDVYDIKKKSENDRPSMFKDGQLYIIFELAHGGQDLEAFVFKNATESFSIFLQTAFTLAVAEKSLEFEHRDMHWGNLLISKTDETESTYKLQDNKFSLPTNGVKVSVIDFTLSRMSYQGCKIFNDLATDPSLFAAQGEYQFEIYRLMRDTVNNDWQQFNPYTNVLWLDYALDKMIREVNYKKKTTKIHKAVIEQMKDLRKEILNYSSAYDFVSNCNVIADAINV